MAYSVIVFVGVGFKSK